MEGFGGYGGQGFPITGWARSGCGWFSLEKSFALVHFEEVGERDLMLC